MHGFKSETMRYSPDGSSVDMQRRAEIAQKVLHLIGQQHYLDCTYEMARIAAQHVSGKNLEVEQEANISMWNSFRDEVNATLTAIRGFDVIEPTDKTVHTITSWLGISEIPGDLAWTMAGDEKIVSASTLRLHELMVWPKIYPSHQEQCGRISLKNNTHVQF